MANRKKLWIILVAIAAVACGDKRNNSAGRDAASDENVDNYSREDAAGQSEQDSAGVHEMDTVSSPSGIERMNQGDSV